MILILIFSSVLFSQDDTVKGSPKFRKVSIGGIFISVGTGLNIPLGEFNNNSNPVFGLLGRIEYSSTSIFPLVIGGEVTYFGYNGEDEFKALNLLSGFSTRIISYGLTADFSLSNYLGSTYTIPFITADIKYNSIKREISPAARLQNLPESESKFSGGLGLGFTLFIFDFYVKYTYMKDVSTFGAFTKIKIPAIRF
ncbi:MAG: hypothetical protein ACRDFC_00705 [Ignavibacteria bacterium]